MDFPKENGRGNPQETAAPAGGRVGKSENSSIKHPDDNPGDRGRKPVSREHQAITDWLSSVKFRRQLIGGLDERSVWNRIRELNMLYEQALLAERVRYDTLLEEYRKRYGGGTDAPSQDVSSSQDVSLYRNASSSHKASFPQNSGHEGPAEGG